MRDLTEFIFFKNTPFVDFQNTILFKSNEERDDFFLNKPTYSTLNFPDMRFNFVRDRQEIVLPVSYQTMAGYNYCSFLSEIEPNTRYYAYVISYEYVNDKATRVNILIDGIMTFCQGTVLHDLPNVKVTRTHLLKSEYEKRLTELKNNDDVLKTFSKTYFLEEKALFKEFDIIIQSSCDLTIDFGKVDDPKIQTSQGLTYDKMTSPLNLYVVKQKDFRRLMKELAPFPWISQNLTSIIMIPSSVLGGRYEKVEMKSTKFDALYELKDKDETLTNALQDELEPLNKNMDELYKMFDLDEDTRHMLRSEYTTAEIYTYDGQAMMVDNGALNPDIGIEFRSVIVSGFNSEIGIYLRGYRTHNRELQDGSFLNDAIFLRNFDKIPTLIDNYQLALASTANQRQLAESKLIGNRMSSVMGNEDDSAKDKFYNAASILSNVSVSGMFGRFSDEYEFYRQQKAEQADLKLSTPTITEQTTNNSLAIANDFFGIHVKYSKPDRTELDKVKKFYKLFGNQIDEEGFKINLYTHTICNYLQFSGTWILPNCDASIAEMVRAQFENGVRFWHNNNTPNPMTQNILNNTFR